MSVMPPAVPSARMDPKKFSSPAKFGARSAMASATEAPSSQAMMAAVQSGTAVVAASVSQADEAVIPTQAGFRPTAGGKTKVDVSS